MSKRRYKVVQSRDTVHLLPACLDDYVAPDNPVRAIDAYVASLDLQALGLRPTEASLGAGHPADETVKVFKRILQKVICTPRKCAFGLFFANESPKNNK